MKTKERPCIQSSFWVHRKDHKPRLRVVAVNKIGKRRQKTFSLVNASNLDKEFIEKAFVRSLK